MRAGTQIEASSWRRAPRPRAAFAPTAYQAGSRMDASSALTDVRSPTPVSQVTAAAIRSGFRSKHKTLSTTVGIALAHMGWRGACMHYDS